MPVEHHDAARLVLHREGEARQARQAARRELLLVELHRRGRGGELARRGLLPAARAVVPPLRGHGAHLVVPGGARLDGGGDLHGHGGGQREVGVVAQEDDGVEVGDADVGLHAQEGALLPELLRALHHHRDARHAHAQRVRHLRLVLLRGSVVHHHQRLARGVVLHAELLVGGEGRVGAQQAQHRARALRDRQRQRARNAAILRRGDHIGGAGGGLGDARDAAGGGQVQPGREGGRDGAVGELAADGLDRHALVEREEGVGGHGVLDGGGRRAVAHQQVHLVDAHVRGRGGRDGDTVVLVGLGVRHGRVVRRRLDGVLPARRDKHGGGARDLEAGGRGGHSGGGEHARAVHGVEPGRGVVVEQRHGLLVGGEGHAALVEVHRLGRVQARRRGQRGHGGHDVALAVGEGARVQRQERAEGGLRAGLQRVQLDRQHRLRALRLVGGAHQAAVLHRLVGAGGQSGRGHLAGGHVVAEDLRAVDVGDDAELVVHAQLHRGHVLQTDEGLAEVQSGREGERRGGGVVRPGGVLVAVGVPLLGELRGHFPGVRFLHGGVQGERDALLLHLRHERLQNDVAVLSLKLDEGAIVPRVAQSVLQHEGVLVFGRSRQAHVVGLGLVHLVRRTLVDDFGACDNLDTLLSSISRAGLGDLHEDLIIGASRDRNRCKN